MSELIEFGWFRSHSGLQLPWKFDCDALSDGAIEGIAKIIRSKFAFGRVIGIPRGGLRLAAALDIYDEPGYPTLIVDDVLTTGKSMEAMFANVCEPSCIGFVIVARAPTPNWVWSLLSVNDWAQARGTGLG